MTAPFPDGALDTVVEMAFGADLGAAPHTWTWTDLSDRLLGDTISITRGTSQGASEAGAQSGSVHLTNEDGWLTPKNPGSPYTISRATPGRVRVRPHVDDAADDFNRPAATGWGTSVAGRNWGWVASNPVTAATDIFSTGTTGVHHFQQASQHRTSYLGMSAEDADVYATATIAALPVGGAVGAGVVCRVASTSTYVTMRAQVAPGSGAITAVISQRLNGTDFDAASVPTGLTYTPGMLLRLHGRVDGSDMHIKIWLGAGAEPAAWSASATDAFVLGAGGHGVRSTLASGATTWPDVVYDDVSVVPSSTRLAGYCDEWKPSIQPLSGGGTWSSVRVSISGIRRRLAAQQPPARSPIRAAAELYRSTGLLLAYWPLEDSADAKTGINVIAASRPMTSGALKVNWGAFTPPAGVPWSRRWGTAPIADLSDGGRLSGNVGKLGTSSPAAWAVRWIAAVYAPAFGSSIKLAQIDLTGGTWARLEVNYSVGGSIQLTAYTPDGAASLLHDLGVAPTALAEYQVDAVQAGANVTVRLWALGSSLLSGSFSTITLGRVLRVILNPVSVVNSAASNDLGKQWAAGHVQVWDTHNIPINADSVADPDSGHTARVWEGWARESAHRRISRLCTAEGVPALVWGIPQDGTATVMGAQPDAPLLELIADAASTDGGLLYEDGFRLAYLPRPNLYNQAAAMTIDLAAYKVTSGGSANVLQPVYDDAGLLNDATVSRTGGSEARIEDTAHIAANGRYTGSRTINPVDDDALPQHASWDVRRGTVDELRYPDLELDLAANPELIGAWIGCELGARIDRTGAPAPVHPAGTVRHLLEGYTETIAPRTWSVRANCSPYSPWQVGVIEDTVLGRADTTGSQLAEALTSSATSVKVATTSGPLWITGSAAPAFPLDVTCGGERVAVSQITQPTISYVAAGTAASANYAPVVPGLPAGIAAGDLLLCWAVTRNATVAELTGWTTIYGNGPTKLLARVATASNSVPTITPTGGASGDDVIAQVAAFRGLWFNPSRVVMRLPKAGPETTQNILTPGAIVDWDNSLILYLAFKQDDWSSITNPGNLIGANVSTAGNDAGMAWAYQTQVARVPVGPAPWTVTGGATAATRGAVVVIRQDVQQFTIVRGPAARAHAAGASLSLADPMRIAL